MSSTVGFQCSCRRLIHGTRGCRRPPALQTGRGEIGAQGFCPQSSILGQNPKIGCQEFNGLQMPTLSKKQLCDRTLYGTHEMRLPGFKSHPLGGTASENGLYSKWQLRVTFRFEGTDAVSVNYEDYP